MSTVVTYSGDVVGLLLNDWTSQAVGSVAHWRVTPTNIAGGGGASTRQRQSPPPKQPKCQDSDQTRLRLYSNNFAR